MEKLEPPRKWVGTGKFVLINEVSGAARGSNDEGRKKSRQRGHPDDGSTLFAAKDPKISYKNSLGIEVALISLVRRAFLVRNIYY